MSLRERQRAQTRRHLLAVATRLIRENGFDNTSIDRIVKTAGASRATFYAYFDSKGAILVALIGHVCDEAAEMYGAFGMLKEWTRESVSGWVRDAYQLWTRDHAVNLAALEARNDQLLEVQEQQNNRFVDALMQAPELWTARFTPGEARRRALILISLLESYMVKLFNFTDPGDHRAAIDTLIDVWVEVLHIDQRVD